jgi:hypothetical protein
LKNAFGDSNVDSSKGTTNAANATTAGTVIIFESTTSYATSSALATAVCKQNNVARWQK